jgi:hypothetical protein
MGHASYGNNSQQDPQSPKKPDPATVPKSEKAPPPELPAAGPHAHPDLTNEGSTPGAGTLPEAGEPDGTDSTSG